MKTATTEPDGFALEAATLTELRVQANGSADFGGTVSSSQFTADQARFNEQVDVGVAHPTDDAKLRLRTGGDWFLIEAGEEDGTQAFTQGGIVQLPKDSTGVSRITASGGLTVGNVFGAAPTNGIYADGGLRINASVQSATSNLSLEPASRVEFAGDNLSTSAGSVREYLTVETTNGPGKIPVHNL